MGGMKIAHEFSLKHHGEWDQADQGAILRLASSSGMESANRGGVCWEVCRRWVHARLIGTWESNSTIYSILSPVKEGGFDLDEDKLEELIKTHAARNISGKEENYKIDGLTNHVTQYRTYSWGSAKGLSSRDAVLKVIFDTPGAYIFSFIAKAGGGHAIAFDTTGTKPAMMDPNSGEGTFPTSADFKTFFKDYYGKVYKETYHRGERELTLYTRA